MWMRGSIVAALLLPMLGLGRASATEIVCHRGANKAAPENTLSAAETCVRWGMDYVEFDVRRSRDGVMFVMHDAMVDRTTDGTGLLNQLESSQVDALDAGSWFSPEFSGERVPRLREYLAALKGRIRFYFDVKDADIPALIAQVHELGIEKDSFFWFDKDDRAREFRRLAPDLRLKVNAATPEEVAAAADEFDADIIEVRLRNATPEFLEACRSRGIAVMVYEPLLDREAFARIVTMGADMVNLNHGDVFRAVQRELTPPPDAAAAP